MNKVVSRIKKVIWSQAASHFKMEICTVFTDGIKQNGEIHLAKNSVQKNTNNARPKVCKDWNILQKFHKLLTFAFYKLGVTIADYPAYFIIAPLLVCLLGATGFQRMKFITDAETLFYPSNGPALDERSRIEHFFPLNSSHNFMPYYITRVEGFARILIEPKDKGSIFHKYLWDEILEVDQLVQNITISYKRNSYNYRELCANRGRRCIPNPVLSLYNEIEDIENGLLKINYPIMVSPLIVPMFFGGITLDKNNFYMKSAKALTLIYFLKTDSETDKERALVWEREFISALGRKRFKYLDIFRSSAASYEEITAETPKAIVPFIPFVAVLLVLFSVGNTMMFDWVRSKVYIGLIGLLSAAISAGGAFGYMMHFGVPTAGINYISPFLIIGIGMDDMFVMLAAWRRTSLQDDVGKRLGQAYSDSGLSMLITSLTNFVSFLIGITAPVLSIRIFCIYTAASVFMMYIVHMTFFGGCLALFGRLERNQRHALCFSKVKAKSQIDEKKKWYYIFCAGGINPNDPWNPKDNKPLYCMVLFRDYLGKMLTTFYAKCIVIILFIIYLCGSIYGILNLSEGYDKASTVRTDSYLYDYIIKEETLFRQHPYTIQVMITGDILYSNKTIQSEIMSLHQEFERLPYIGSSTLTQSWMPGWFRRVRRRDNLRNISSEKQFIKELRETFLSSEDNLLYFDVAYNEDYNRITASRFFLQTKEIKDSNEDTKMMNELRAVAKRSPLNITVFNPNFVLFDHGNFVKPAVIQATTIAAASMVLISFILIPNTWCSLYVGFTIISIELGVIGYMALWDVKLSFISMICLIMCIGFSVDFTAHITHSYCISKAKTPDEKIMDSLYCLGLPILQGGLSTICSILVFVFVPAYVYVYFFKVVFLVVLFAGLHGLFLMPILLSIAGPDTLKIKCKSKSKNSISREHTINHIPNNVT